MIFLYIALVLLFLVLVYLFLIAPSFYKNPDVEKLGTTVFAHRGLHKSDVGIPENSMAAFERAVSYNTGIELDVRLTADGVPVIMHDASANRTAGEDKNIIDMTAEEVKKLRLEGTEQTVPTLLEVLSYIDGRVPLLIEMKTSGNNSDALCSRCFELLDQYKGDFLLESFDPTVLYWLRKNRPTVGRGQLATDKIPNSKIYSLLSKNLFINVVSRPHFIACNQSVLEKSIAVHICRRLFGSRLCLWTVKDEKTARSFLEKGVSIIFESFLP